MRLSKPLFWLITLLWFFAGAWWYGSCSKCTTCADTALPTTPVAAEKLPGFAVADSNWNLSTADNLRFGKSGSVPVLGTDINRTLDSLSVYAKEHPGKTITITGHYKTGETNTSSFEHLGLARADEMKKWLVSKGVADANIITQSQLDESLYFNAADTLIGGISMIINSATAAPVVPLKEDLFAPRTVYFNTGKNTLNVDAELKNYLQQANTYLQSHPDKKLLVTGYTDNVGDPDKNIQLSANRAAFVKGELVKQGLTNDRMESSGKGMADPAADNATAEGRAKNRRVTIQLE
jgi:OmpA-OmpF porin, OOP family